MDIKWEDSLSVNVKEIDDQHKHFIGLLNKFNDSIMSGGDDMDAILSDLTSYAERHFATEEMYFDKFNYEDAEDHKRKHAEMKSELTEYIEQMKTNKIDGGIKMINFLQKWLVEHLHDMDSKYTKCFNEHGLF